METHQLEAKLKSLRLSGMLDTLEARLAQARGGELGHLEFLEVLLEDEIGRREAKALSERIRRARFEGRRRLRSSTSPTTRPAGAADPRPRRAALPRAR